MEFEQLGAPKGCVPFSPAASRREMQGFRYASGHRIHVGDRVTAPAHPEWGTLKVRALNPMSGRVVASSPTARVRQVEPSELAWAGEAE